MIGRSELALGCRGLLHLARFDAGFLRYFDRTAAGALRSFQVAVLTLPFYLLSLSLEIDQTVPDAAQYVTARMVGFAYNWISFPLILLFVGGRLDRDAETPGCLAVYNWMSLLWMVLQLPLLLLFAINRESTLAAGLNYLLLFYSMLIEGFVFTRMLRIALWQAGALVAGDVILNIYVIAPVSQYLGGMAPP